NGRPLHLVFRLLRVHCILLVAVRRLLTSYALTRPMGKPPLIHNNLRPTAMIQLKPGLSPSSLNCPRKSSLRTKNRAMKKKSKGLRFERVFSDASVAPFDQVDWERRTAEITDDSGKVIFKQENIEVPKSWSALATKIAVSKYFYGDIANGTDPHKGGRETSVRQ